MSQLTHKITICGKCTLKTCGECDIKVFGKCDGMDCENEGELVVVYHAVHDGVEEYTAVCRTCNERTFEQVYERNQELCKKYHHKKCSC